ncbi:hypothetical protein DIPPA_04041 [Diplonema papillatum]|nr:hypothetical protein DIPPA_04041 [Diplonema papillatum]
MPNVNDARGAEQAGTEGRLLLHPRDGHDDINHGAALSPHEAARVCTARCLFPENPAQGPRLPSPLTHGHGVPIAPPSPTHLPSQAASAIPLEPSVQLPVAPGRSDSPCTPQSQAISPAPFAHIFGASPLAFPCRHAAPVRAQLQTRTISPPATPPHAPCGRTPVHRAETNAGQSNTPGTFTFGAASPPTREQPRHPGVAEQGPTGGLTASFGKERPASRRRTAAADLPFDLWVQAVGYLPAVDLVGAVALACRRLHRLAHADRVWRERLGDDSRKVAAGWWMLSEPRTRKPPAAQGVGKRVCRTPQKEKHGLCAVAGPTTARHHGTPPPPGPPVLAPPPGVHSLPQDVGEDAASQRNPDPAGTAGEAAALGWRAAYFAHGWCLGFGFGGGGDAARVSNCRKTVALAPLGGGGGLLAPGGGGLPPAACFRPTSLRSACGARSGLFFVEFALDVCPAHAMPLLAVGLTDASSFHPDQSLGSYAGSLAYLNTGFPGVTGSACFTPASSGDRIGVLLDLPAIDAHTGRVLFFLNRVVQGLPEALPPGFKGPWHFGVSLARAGDTVSIVPHPFVPEAVRKQADEAFLSH